MKKKTVKIKEPKATDPFYITLIAIIYDPKERKILIGRKESDPDIPGLTWCFPGTELNYGNNISDVLKKKVKEKTGYDIKNLGSVFSKVYPENKKLMGVYFLCEAIKGKLKAGGHFKELKWVMPQDIEKHFTSSFHPRLREYLLHLR